MNMLQILFKIGDDKVCSQQPLGCTDAMDHPDCIRMDDIGLWENMGLTMHTCSYQKKKVSLKLTRPLQVPRQLFIVLSNHVGNTNRITHLQDSCIK